MRYFRDLSLLGLYCLGASFYGKSDIKMVAAVLCTVIMVCGCYSCTQKYRQGILLAYGLSGFWNGRILSGFILSLIVPQQ